MGSSKPFSSIFFLILSAVTINGTPASLFYLYQRTTYLENLLQNDGWWANPALTGEITEKSASTVDVTPLADQFTIVSAKYSFPIGKSVGAGFGIMGNTGLSSQNSQRADVTNEGLTFNSHYSFTNPGFQCAVGIKNNVLGSIGLLVNIGAEMLPDGNGTESNFLLAGTGIGILTPYFFKTVSLSATTFSTWHFWGEYVYMDNDGKLGLRFKILDDFILGSLERTFSYKSNTMRSFYTTISPYQVFKGLLSFRFYKIAGFLVGYGTDNGDEYSPHLGNTLHIGLELRPSSFYPYYGGYELGISTTVSNTVIHRVWVGYKFINKN